MMPRKFASLAEKYRHHRKCFELALELGVTPPEAEQRMALMEIRERERARASARMSRDAQRQARANTEQRGFERWDAPHMMRD